MYSVTLQVTIHITYNYDIERTYTHWIKRFIVFRCLQVNVQLIEKDGHPIFAVIPYDEYQALLSKTRVNREHPELDKVMTAVDAGEETFPLEFVEKLIETDSKLREWRKYRRLTQVELAKTANLSQAAIASVESGKRIPQMDTAKKLARALRCDIDDLFG